MTETIGRLLAARAAIWRRGTVPRELAALWQEARTALPDWPGFRRVELSPETRAALRSCEEGAAGFYTGLALAAEEFTVSTPRGDERWSTTVHIAPQRPARWWEFWRGVRSG